MKIVNFKDIPESWFNRSNIEVPGGVRQILKDVRERGDEAVREYSQQFDGFSGSDFIVKEEEIKQAYEKVDGELVQALKKAATNIESFARLQMSMFQTKEMKTEFGIIGHKIIPLQRVGCYVPGGNYPLPSTALMTVIPARVAGVKEIIVCSPKIKPETIVAADIAGATKILRIGGVQAIGALAYGTESIPQVDKIVGPGNKYVTAAKREVYGKVGIDFLAGPSEVMVVTDCTADPRLVAADLLAQAEHDVNAEANAIVCCNKLGKKILNELEYQLSSLATHEIAKESIAQGMIIVCPKLQGVETIVNQKAPEHLELMVEDPNMILEKITNFGSLFIGNASAEVFGDYCSGPNHVLPTDGVARYTGGLSVKDFIKIVTFQEIRNPTELIEISSLIAKSEGLDGHRKAALSRLHNL